jgi:glycine hydroxymethyltransferase
VVAEWGGRFVYDGAHTMGLIAGGQFQDPLAEGAALITGSAGKTFAGPQSGMIAWNDPELTEPLTTAIFPVLAATHQVNRVAALAVSAAEMLQYGELFMSRIVENSKALGAALDAAGIPVLGKDRGYSASHQVIADVAGFGGGLEVAHRLADANLITNKNLLPADNPEDWDRPSGLRMGTIEVTRLGMDGADMATIAGFIAQVLVNREPPERVKPDVEDFRRPFQDFYYCFDNGLPPDR